MADFEGVFPAIITPMTAEDEVNLGAFREVMEFNIQAGVQGFWVAGGGGESVLLSDEENTAIAEAAADQSRGRAKVIMHVGAPTTARAAAMAERAAAAGVDAICCVPPFFYPVTDEAIVEHYRVVAAAADLPLFAYNLPSSTGVDITPDLMKLIQDGVPQLAGLKHSAMDASLIRTFADMGLSCFTGSSKLMLAALMMGGVGCVDGAPCAAPERWVEIWNAYQAGDMDRAKESQVKATEAFSVTMRPGYGYPANIKALLSERLGIDCGNPRLPLLPFTPEQRAQIREDAARIGLTKIAVS